MSFLDNTGALNSGTTHGGDGSEEISSQFSNLNVGTSKKKRSNRVFHTDITNTSISNVEQDRSAATMSPKMGMTHELTSFGQHEAENGRLEYTGEEEGSLSLPEYRYQQQQQYMSYSPKGEFGVRNFSTFENASPPSAITQVHCIDQGTCSSKFMRSTMYFVPESESLREATKLPVAVTVRPFAPKLVSEDDVPVVDMRQDGDADESDPLNIGPPRCRRCRTYINPSMQFTSSGRFTCNICQFANNKLEYNYNGIFDSMFYPSQTAPTKRPELQKGVYDLIVPDEYNVGGTGSVNHSLHHVFLIDVSEQSIRQSIPSLVADSVRTTLYGNDVDAKSVNRKIAIITFDKRLRIYNLSPSLNTCQVSILSDLEDPFIPFHEGLFADPYESRDLIEDVLNHLELICSDSDIIPEAEPCYAAACRVAMMCLEPYGGGKITSVLTSLPSWGPGGLSYKTMQPGKSSIETEKHLFLPNNAYYQQLAKDFVSSNVGVDCMIVSNNSVDVSNVGWLCAASGGQVFNYPDFNIEVDGRTFMGRFASTVLKTRGYQGQLKLRCSNGLQVSQYYGTSYVNPDSSPVTGASDPHISVLDEDQSFTILMTYDGKLSTNYDCHFQAALLYTDVNGLRKVRVINLVLAVAERLEDVFNLTDEDAIATTIIRDTLSFVGEQPVSELRDSVNSKMVEVFTQYRAMSELGHNQNGTLTNKLLLPEKLKHLPLYILAFIKSKAISSSPTIAIDARLVDAYQMLKMPIERLLYHLYPALIELHSLSEYDGVVNPDYNFVNLPVCTTLSIKNLDPSAYILCDGMKIYFWVHPSVNILLLQDIFGEHIQTFEDLDASYDELPELVTSISLQVRNLVKYFQSEIIGLSLLDSASIEMIREGVDAKVSSFKEMLVEDNSLGTVISSKGPAYSEYLVNLHKAIRVKLDNDKSSNKVRESVNSAAYHETLAQRIIHY